MMAQTPKRGFLFHPHAPTILLMMSIVAFIFFLMFWYFQIDVYKYAVVGAVYEILWLPMLASIAVVPILAIFMLIKNPKSVWFGVVSLLFIAASVFILVVNG